MSNLLILVYSNIDHWGLRNLVKTLEKNKFNYIVTGKGDKWEGFHTKMKGVVKELKNIDPDTIVSVIDAFDVFIAGNPDDMLRSFRSFESPIVVGSENINMKFPVAERYYSRRGLDMNDYRYRYINGGSVMGVVPALIEMYEWILEEGYTDDQHGIIEYTNKYPKRLELDLQQQITANLSSFDPIEYKKGQAYKPDTKTWPVVIHIPGCTWDFWIRMDTCGGYLLGEDYESLSISKKITTYSKELYKAGKTYIWILFILAICFIYYKYH